MTIRRTMIAGAFVGMIAGLSWLAFAKPMDPPPPQWVDCVKHGEGECASGGDDTISWADAESDLRVIQDWAARSLHYRPEGGAWLGFNLPGEWWADCVDYALTIRRAAIEAGYSPDAMRLMILWDAGKAGIARNRHAALVVFTHDAGPIVFDPLRAQTFCRISACQRRTLKVWTLAEYVTLPGVVPLAIYEPVRFWNLWNAVNGSVGTWRFMNEFFTEDTVTP